MKTIIFYVQTIIFLFFVQVLWATNLVQVALKDPRYQALSKIGNGTYGVVFDEGDHVVKVSPLLFEHSKDILEAALLKSLNHEGIPKPLKITIYKGQKHKFLEIHMPKYSSVSSKDGQEIFKQMTAALSYVHALNIAHRDIKKEHILGLDTSLVLIDWGGADIFSAHPIQHKGTALGYQSPSLLIGDYRHVKDDDLWALGVSLLRINQKWEAFEKVQSGRDVVKLFLEEARTQEFPDGSQTLKTRIALAEPFVGKDYLAKMLKVKANLRLSAQGLLSELGEAPKNCHKKFDDVPRSFAEGSTMNGQKRDQALAKIFNAVGRLELPPKVLFEAMSIADQFFHIYCLNKDYEENSIAAVALFLAAGFYSERYEIKNILPYFMPTLSESALKNLLLDLIEKADFNLIFNHSLRQYQDEIYKNGLDSNNRDDVILMLALLEIDEKTYMWPNEKKWRFAYRYGVNPKTLSFEHKNVLQSLDQRVYKKNSSSKL